MGTGDGARARALGAGVAKGTLMSSHKLLVGGGRPDAGMERLPSVWMGYFDAAQLVAGRLGPKSFRLIVSEGPDDQHMLSLLCGFTERLLGLCGATAPRSAIRASRARGNPESILHIRWS